MEELEQIRQRMKNAEEARLRIDDAYDVQKLLKVIDEVLHTLDAWENYYDGYDIADAMVFSMSRSVRGSMKRAMK